MFVKVVNEKNLPFSVQLTHKSPPMPAQPAQKNDGSPKPQFSVPSPPACALIKRPKKNQIQIRQVTNAANNAEIKYLTDEDGREPPDLCVAVAVAVRLGGGGTGMVVVGNPTPPGPILIVSFPITIVVGMAPIPIG